MLSNFKEIVKEKKSDIFLTVSIILVALTSFGAGLLIDFSEDSSQIIIQNPLPVASIQQSLKTNQPILEEKTEDKKFVGSVNSNKYHWPECSFGKRISEENQIWFNSESDARDAGYVPCGSFDKYNN